MRDRKRTAPVASDHPERTSLIKRKNTRAGNLGESGHGMIGDQLVVCVSNEGYPASLEKRKIYMALRDAGAAKLGLLRVTDESGEYYLYPKTLFRPIVLPRAVKRAVLGT
jgi:hypothetical protein